MKTRYVNLEYHPNDSRIKLASDEPCQSLTSRMGTGGNNVPLVLQIRYERANSFEVEVRDGQGSDSESE